MSLRYQSNLTVRKLFEISTIFLENVIYNAIYAYYAQTLNSGKVQYGYYGYRVAHYTDAGKVRRNSTFVPDRFSWVN